MDDLKTKDSEHEGWMGDIFGKGPGGVGRGIGEGYCILFTCMNKYKILF